MPTALVTGVRGFTGQYLVPLLEAKGFRVCGVVHNIDAPREQEFCVDLCDRKAVNELVCRVRPDVVVHLAAISFVAHDDVGEIYRTNILGTRNLLEAIAGSGISPHAVVLASSANVYGSSETNPIIETTAFNPANDYAVSKLAMEYMARQWMEKFPIVLVRPFNYTGMGQSLNFLIPKIVDHFQRGERVIELGNLDVARDFSDVRMVAEAYVRLMEMAPAGEAFNICSGVATSLGAVLDMMAEIAGYAIQVRVNPDFVRENEIKCLRGSNQKLVDTVGTLEAIPLEQTLRWMYEAGVK